MQTASKRIIRKPSPDALVAALAQLDIDFVMCASKVSGARLASRPATLLAGLAQQDEARLRLSIIPLLLSHPDFASAAPEAVRQLDPRRREYFKLFYTAAVFLQIKHADRLRLLVSDATPLVDWYSKELGIRESSNPDAGLRALGEKHRHRSGLALNWLGTYEHALERFVRHLQKEREWAQSRQTTYAPI